MGSAAVPISGFKNTNNAKDIAANQRNLLWNYGTNLDQQAQQQAGKAGGQADYYQQLLDNYLGPQAAGQGGYNPQEQAAILGLQGGNGIPGLSDLGTSTDQLNSNYLTPEEQAGIAGNPNTYGGYFDTAGMDQGQNDSAGFQRAAVGQLQGNLQGAIDPNALKQSTDYLGRSSDTLGKTYNGVTGAINSEAGNVRGAIDPAALSQSADAAKQIQMTPEQQQDIIDKAGISAGIRNQAAVGDLQRQTAAAGGSPEAVAAYRARMGRASAAEASDAMTSARVAASNAAAERALQGEQQRLGAQQYLTGTKTGAELNLGQQAQQAQMALGQQALQQGNTQEQQRLGAQQYLTGAGLQAATIGGEAAIGNEQAINSQNRQNQQFQAQQGFQIAQAQDQANAQRAAAVAANRQGVNQSNQQTQYNQGLTANQLASQRQAQVAGTRLGTQQNALGMYGGLQSQANQNQQNAYAGQRQLYGTTASGTNQAAGLGVQASAQPGIFDKVTGAVLGAAGAASGLGLGVAKKKP